jgi:hypothetical protein
MRRTILTPLLLLAVVAVCTPAIWYWQRCRLERLRRLQPTTPAQMDILATVCVAQEHFKQAAYVDQDGDGIGEYGFLSELAGLDGRRTASGQPTRVALIPPALGLGALRRGGTGSWEGICVRVDLATGHGHAASAPGPRETPAAIDRQEELWLAYGWAATEDLPIPTAVALGPDATYRIRFGPDQDPTHHYIGLQEAPAPGAAMDPSPPRPPDGQSLEDARRWWSDPDHSRIRNVDALEGELSSQGMGSGDGATWAIGSDGWVGVYGKPLAASGWQGELDDLLRGGLPAPCPPLAPSPPGTVPPAQPPPPPAPLAEPRWLEVPLESRFILVLDSSRSMAWGQVPREVAPPDLPQANPWQALIHQLAHLLRATCEEQEMGLALMDLDPPRTWKEELVPCTKSNVQEAIRWLSELALEGESLPGSGVRAACTLADGEPLQMILITDGVPSTGVHTPDVIRATNTCNARIDLVLYGAEARPEYVAPATRETGGAVLRFP